MEFVVEEKRFALKDGNNTVSWVEYELSNSDIHLLATHTAKGFEGRGYAGKIVEFSLRESENYSRILVSCPYIKRWIEKNGYKSEKITFTELLKFKEDIEFFNRYHSPETTANFLRYENGFAFVKFTGYLCYTCGVYDYFEDLIQQSDAEIVDYEENEEGFVVKYRLKKLI